MEMPDILKKQFRKKYQVEDMMKQSKQTELEVMKGLLYNEHQGYLDKEGKLTERYKHELKQSQIKGKKFNKEAAWAFNKIKDFTSLEGIDSSIAKLLKERQPIRMFTDLASIKNLPKEIAIILHKYFKKKIIIR